VFSAGSVNRGSRGLGAHVVLHGRISQEHIPLGRCGAAAPATPVNSSRSSGSAASATASSWVAARAVLYFQPEQARVGPHRLTLA